MTLGFLARMLVSDTVLTIKDYETGVTVCVCSASAVFHSETTTVVDWDFSQKHIIYVR